MSQDPRASQFAPPWFLIIGLLAGGAFLVFMLTDGLSSGRSKLAHSKYVIELTAENWKKEVEQCATPVVVDFWAPWCPPCVKLSPTMDKLAERYDGKVKFGKVNVDEQKKLAQAFKIGPIPCVIIFDNNREPAHVLQGAGEEKDYIQLIDTVLAKK